MEIWQVFVIIAVVLIVYGILFLILSIIFNINKKRLQKHTKNKINDNKYQNKITKE